MGKKLLIIAILTTFLILMVPNISAIQTQAINSEVIELTSETKNIYEKILDFIQQIPDQTKSDEITMQTLSDHKESILSFIKNSPKGDIPDDLWVFIRIFLKIVLGVLFVVGFIAKILNFVMTLPLYILLWVLDHVTEWFLGFFFLEGFVKLLIGLHALIQEILKYGPLQQLIVWLQSVIDQIEDYINSQDENPTF